MNGLVESRADVVGNEEGNIVFGLSIVVFGLMKANGMAWLNWSAEGVACLGVNEPND